MRLNLGLGLVGVALTAAIALPLASGPFDQAAAQTVGPQKPSKSAKKAASKVKEATDAKSARSPAETDRILDSAAKSIADGNPDAAMTTLDGLLASGGLPNNQMARALYLRGVAHRRKGRPAQALADLTSAIWLKGGLNDTDRNAALKERDEVSREAGVADAAAPEGSARPAVVARSEPAGAASAPPPASPRVISAPLPVSPPAAKPASSGLISSPPPPSSGEISEGGFPRAVASAPKSNAPPARTALPSDISEGGFPRSSTSAPPQPAAPPPESANKPSSGSSGGLGEFFSGFFTGNKPSETPSASGPAKRSTEVSAWSTSTNASDRKPAPPSARVVTSSTPQKAGPRGAYRLQIAAVRSRKEAEAVAARVKQDHARVLGAYKPEVDETVFGNMGTFYRVRLGPFAAADEPKALCEKLRSSGYDCLVVSQ